MSYSVRKKNLILHKMQTILNSSIKEMKQNCSDCRKQTTNKVSELVISYMNECMSE
jgi:hypothetical protein